MVRPFGDQALLPHMMVRQGIPYGPEVTPGEAQSNTTKVDRGLAFTCYQSDIAKGFEFVQECTCLMIHRLTRASH